MLLKVGGILDGDNRTPNNLYFVSFRFPVYESQKNILYKVNYKTKKYILYSII